MARLLSRSEILDRLLEMFTASERDCIYVELSLKDTIERRNVERYGESIWSPQHIAREYARRAYEVRLIDE